MGFCSGFFERARLALRLKEAIAAEAKAKQESILKQNIAVNQKSDEREINTNKELAKVAGVSHDTIHKVDVIEQKAPEEVKAQLRRGWPSVQRDQSGHFGEKCCLYIITIARTKTCFKKMLFCHNLLHIYQI